MPGSASQYVDRLDWEGLVDVRATVVLWIVLALVAGWSLWRERKAVGRVWATAFWLMRLAAFGCVLWMLAGPVWLRIGRSTSNQTIALFADNSESMDVVDPVEPAESVRWALAFSDANESPVAHCDRLAVDLGSASAGCQQLARYLAEHRDADDLRSVVTSIDSALKRASSHADAVLASLDGGDTSLADRGSRVAALVQGPIHDIFQSIRADVTEPKGAVSGDVAARIDALLENLTGTRRRASVVSTELARQTEANALHRTAVDRLTRREKEARALDAFEKEMSDQLSDNVRVERFQFVDAPVPVAPKTAWSRVLQGRSFPSAAADDIHQPNPSPATAGENPRLTGSSGMPTSEVTTNLSAVLEQLSKLQPAGSTRMAIIWSDGRHNDASALAPQDVAAGLGGVPLYFIPIGNSAPLRDIILYRVEAPTVVAEKDTAVIDVIVTAFECDGEASEIVLRKAGAEVERKTVEFTGNHSDARTRFTLPASEAGRQEFVVEVEPLDDETNTANNYLPVAYDVIKDSVRILLADSFARWEYRYLSQLFRRDSHVACDELLYGPDLIGTGRLAQLPELPRDVAGWSNYDVVILGDLDSKALPEESQKSLAEFIRSRGGNLIVIAGPDSMPRSFATTGFMDLLPVEQGPRPTSAQGFNLRLTDEGRINSALMIEDSDIGSREAWQRVYSRQPIEWLSDFSKTRSTARTLIEAPAAHDSSANEWQPAEGEKLPAFMCWQRVGAGRVVYLAAPDTYRLRFRQGDRMHHRFWGQLLRWITASGAGAGTDLVRLQTDRMRYSAGESVEVTVWLKDKTGVPLAGQTIQAEARDFDEVATAVELIADPEVAGRYFGTLDKLAAGAYKIVVKGPIIAELLAGAPDTELVQSTISVRDADSVELLNTQCNRALLEQLAQLTGGQVIPPTAIGEVLQLNSFTPEVVERTDRTPLWNRWSYGLVVLGCVFTEWIVRKTKGLV